jgi:hypothetical protein
VSDSEPHLTHLATRWTLIDRARGTGDSASAARVQLLDRYYQVVKRFLEKKLPHDRHVAMEILGRFCDGVLEGESFLFRANQKAGRFRYYLKRILSNKINDYYRAGAPQVLDEVSGKDAVEAFPPGDKDMQEFLDSCSQEVLDGAWTMLHKHEEATGQPFYTVCRCQYANADKRSAEKATLVSQQLGKTITPENYRKLVERGQDKLADLLVAEVVRMLKPFAPERISADMIEEELRELNLFSFCERAVQRYAAGAAK